MELWEGQTGVSEQVKDKQGGDAEETTKRPRDKKETKKKTHS